MIGPLGCPSPSSRTMTPVTGMSPFFANYGYHPAFHDLRPRTSASSNPSADERAEFLHTLRTVLKQNLSNAVHAMKRFADAVHPDDERHYIRIGDIDSNTWTTTMMGLKERFKDLHERARTLRSITTKQADNFLRHTETRLPQFHATLKLHKNQWPCPTRPIVGAPAWTTTKLAIFLTTILERIPMRHVLRDSTQLITTIENMEVEPGDILLSADVSTR
ncbi:unnamed protein product (mitochondrion) [Plasmodiophora brassicae]|uniref:Uncharacterized protein n=1 Tax=Plasmodiophora brassicae TaxID=37360 RepID=A0A3P3YA66_PLABS|nr:unnamed protein product [Plasmodiophora brassicae]SPQ97053.1 unnamed protein product [Plasmodiophora brassicae]